MKIKHYIYTRFLSLDFGYDVFNDDFIHYWCQLYQNNFVKTLENQKNQNFEVITLIHNNIDVNKLNELFSTKTSLTIHYIRNKEFSQFIKNHTNDCDYLITSRFDCDDFIENDVVDDIQNKIKFCNTFVSYGYCSGYAYLDGNIYEFVQEYPNGHFSAMQSYIYNVKNLEQNFVYFSCSTHTDVKSGIREFCKNNNIPYKDDMYLRNDCDRKFIWFRHQATGTAANGKRFCINKSSLKNKISPNDEFFNKFSFNSKLIAK